MTKIIENLSVAFI